MKLSTKGRYGVKAMVDLAIHYGAEPVSIKSISERQKISEAYLEQLFVPLRKSGLIKSIRGSQGGYVLSKDPKDIHISNIFDVLEGPIEISDCVESDSCDNSDYCVTRLLWVKIKESIDNVTKTITLKDMVDDYNSIKNQ
ncbi:Rrf2 family protein [Clostridium acetobutylicum]|uniref:Predicted transcriptional regulator (HTH winged helix type) n=1 Tax=Clostridium acetobutylicum (strain ATCC 824 / DSM 792 / JCM 1419 / IAM 19013 / LMG 5710 / NBRC 13948 / NRRL B-527 / VKM B-1787 / 2291 / W) TaxID=272562 RepID=Q97IG6_CLOAB|nr:MULTISPECIES: Rrf2 family transcriptional regulator [Clostridium]AAK79641.1 Predicted transcriptional regulator (HTH winged helix type) [Clostridium acetobutylicum ATCC 824]ADZ20725.1 transcriptional regulator (HTH winged helix type) [Clostridium acetobutylicum EA 2018]AEI33891.1 transcriptional regulator [Clostridium acetobutylicum DSM 1731]AWV79923.1 Rrf2 family transcriptional regulator [Clostridium acetobutylicum]KHD37972.1 transcriptional regulator [Clostridium acetobutylicum]